MSSTESSTGSTTDTTNAADFGSFGRYAEIPVSDMDPHMRQAYDLTVELRGGVPGPHKIWLSNPELLRTIAATGEYFQHRSSLAKAEIEIATNVINAHWRAAYANYEHEIIGVRDGGLDPDAVAALIAGLPTSFADPRQQAVYDLASTLAGGRIVGQRLFRRAREVLSDKGIVDVTVLMGWFSAVSLTLNAYDVPSDAKGLDQ